MAFTYWKSVCQHCGAIGSKTTTVNENTPNIQASVFGTCKCHPSGKPNMPHSPKWEKA